MAYLFQYRNLKGNYLCPQESNVRDARRYLQSQSKPFSWSLQKMKMPPQLSVLALVLLLYFWPWQLPFSTGSDQIDWLVLVTTIQFLFVMACNKMSSEYWASLVIRVETLCMFINSVLMMITATLFSMHGYIMTAAFIIELLIITISFKGAVIGRSNSYRYPMARLLLRINAYCLRYIHLNKEARS